MAKSKEQLENEVKALAEELGMEEVQLAPTVEALKKQLETLQQTKAEQNPPGEKGGDTKPPEETTPPPAEKPPEPKEEEVKEAKGYYVNPGCSVSGKSGILSEGQMIKDSHLHGGKKALEELVKKKIVRRVK